MPRSLFPQVQRLTVMDVPGLDDELVGMKIEEFLKENSYRILPVFLINLT